MNLESNILFVSGPPRAGTTLLELVLSSHPDITITPETLFIQQIFNKRPNAHQILTKEEAHRVLQLIKSDSKLNSWESLNVDTFIERFEHKDFTLAELAYNLFKVYAELSNGGSIYIGNKKGFYAEGYGQYMKSHVFPDAKFIFIVRDPRDVVRSIIQNLATKSIINATSILYERDQFINEVKVKFPEDTCIIRYEDLVINPVKVCNEMCSFLNLPFHDDMLHYYLKNQDGEKLVGITKDIHQNTNSNFNPGLIDQWKRQETFSKDELLLIESITSGYMERYGYSHYTSKWNRLLNWNKYKAAKRFSKLKKDRE